MTRLKTADIQPSSLDFLVEFGKALHRYGAPAHRIESAVTHVAKTIDVQCQIKSSPTSITVGIGPRTDQEIFFERIEPGSINLAKLRELDLLSTQIKEKGYCGVDDQLQLNDIIEKESNDSSLVQVGAFLTVSSAGAVLLGGGIYDIAVGSVIGLLTGLLSLFFKRFNAGGKLFEVVASFNAGLVAHLANRMGVPVNYYVTLLAGIIVLIPGLTLTIAMIELSTRNLVSGTARMMSALVVFLQMIFGVALSEKLVSTLMGPPAMQVELAPLDFWYLIAALFLGIFAVALLFKAHAKDYVFIVITAIAAFFVTNALSTDSGPAVAAAAGGLVAGLIANTVARIYNKSALILLVPGILMLVPGSLGFKSINAFWKQDVIGGIDAAFHMCVVAVSLTVGILIANALVSSRRSL